MKFRVASDRIKILVRDRIAPVNQFLKRLAPASVSRIQGVNACPEIDPQPVEIRTNGSGMWIAFIQRAIPDELTLQESLKLRRRSGDNVIDALRMKIAAEALKMRR